MQTSEKPLRTRLALAAGQWSRDTGFPVQMSLAETEHVLPDRTNVQLLQITREALANVAKHSTASQVWVELGQRPDGVAISVRDDGQGFSESQPRGHGLDIMRERAALLSATLTISSAPGEGTEVVVVCPVSQEAG